MTTSYSIAVIPGDGTGLEVINEGRKALMAAAGRFGFDLKMTDFDFGGDRYLRTGEVLPETAVDDLQAFDSIYLGAIGHPDVKPGILEKGILLSLRFALDQYINLRPVKLYPGVDTPLKDKGPKDVDMLICRENTEGAYSGIYGHLKKGTPDEVATQTMVFTRKGVERIIRFAFERAIERRLVVAAVVGECHRGLVRELRDEVLPPDLDPVHVQLPGSRGDEALQHVGGLHELHVEGRVLAHQHHVQGGERHAALGAELEPPRLVHVHDQVDGCRRSQAVPVGDHARLEVVGDHDLSWQPLLDDDLVLALEVVVQVARREIGLGGDVAQPDRTTCAVEDRTRRTPVAPLGDGTFVPAQPPILFIFGEVGGFFPGEDGSRAWCKNAAAHHLMVNRLLDPNSEETSWMLDMMEGIEFLRTALGEPEYDSETNHRLWFDLGGFNKCQPYYRRSVELSKLYDLYRQDYCGCEFSIR